MSDLVDVMLCCNDDNGNNAGRIVAAHFNVGGIELESVVVNHGPTFRRVSDITVRIGRFEYEIFGYREWYGNIFWDLIVLKRPSAVLLAGRLRDWGQFGFDLMAWTDSPDAADLLNACRAKDAE